MQINAPTGRRIRGVKKMIITTKIKVEVPMGFYCKKCQRKERDEKHFMFCTLFNRYLYIRKGVYLKCRECVNALYDEIDSM